MSSSTIEGQPGISGIRMRCDIPMITNQPGSPMLDTLTILSPVDVEFLPWRPVEDCIGVRAKQLWSSADTVCALITYDPGAATPGPPHPAAHHHIWITEGRAMMAGRSLAAGSYIQVPPDTAHPITAASSGCTLLQVHHRCGAHT